MKSIGRGTDGAQLLARRVVIVAPTIANAAMRSESSQASLCVMKPPSDMPLA